MLVDGRTQRACLTLAVQADGSSITTIEGLATGEELGPLQQAFMDQHALQCGFCTPGMLTTLTEFLSENPDPTDAEVRIAISGNLCRCTGYENIVRAALQAARTLRETTPGASTPMQVDALDTDHARAQHARGAQQ